MAMLRFFPFFILVFLGGCASGPDPELDHTKVCDCPLGTVWVPNPDSATLEKEPYVDPGTGALVATRFKSLADFKKVVTVEYGNDQVSADSPLHGPTLVRLRHCSNGREVKSVLEEGVSQKDISKAQKAGVIDQLGLTFRSPYAVINRRDLTRVFYLARRNAILFGEGDMAFYDLAERMVWNIYPVETAFRYARDSSEKGYLNSFNHVTAQAFVTSFFSEELADFIADLHERYNMPELITGKFTAEQLAEPDDNPVDNYVDMVNNEWGQELGKELRARYHISRTTTWTPELMANYLNDIQRYFSWAFQIGFKPFHPEDEVCVTFSRKVNYVVTKFLPD